MSPVTLGGTVSNPLALVRDNPLTVQAGTTATISAADNLAVSDTEYSDAQITYTVVTEPSDGMLLDDGARTSTFTQSDLDNALVGFEEITPWSGQALSDSFYFYASDPSDNKTATTLFQINITAPPVAPVDETAPNHITVHADLTAAITGIQIGNQSGNSDTFKTIITDATGILLASGASGVVSGSGSNSLSITGSVAQVNAALDTLDYVSTSSGSDTITVTSTDLGDQSSVSENIGVTVKPAGNFTSLDNPQALSQPNYGTQAYGINDQGQITGSYSGEDFVYSGGTYTSLNVGTVQGINGSGEIVGFENTGNFENEGVSAFIYSGGVSTPYVYSQSNQTYFEGVNDQGEIVGYASDYSVRSGGFPPVAGFIYQNGTFQVIGPPNTEPYGVNNEGQVVGTAYLSSIIQGFPEDPQGFFYSNSVFSLLQAPSASQTFARGINDADLIVGYYDNKSGTHGFAYNEVTGVWSPIDVPGATATYVYGINNSDQIVGAYVDENGNTHGFVGMLPPPFPSSTGNNDEWILSDGQWLASAGPGSHPSGSSVAGVGDFTDSGTDGILWYDASTGDVDEWKISYGAWAGSIDLGTHPGSYQIAGVGDFTGNGTDDVLWTSVSGSDQVQTDIWELNNGQWAASVSPGSHPAGYQVAGIGDWTGSGTDGVLWYNSTTGDTDEWHLVNGQWVASVGLGVHPGSGWSIAGVGDFFGNGIDDVLWTNSTSGQVQTDIWELGSNGQWINSVSPGSHPAGSQVVGIGDFTGNGASDILWQNMTTGDVDEWQISNGKWAASIDLGVHPGNYQIAGVGDFTGSGTSDILWHSGS